MADRTVYITKTFAIGFNDGDGYEDKSNVELEELALEALDSFVRDAAEYTEFNTRESCDAIFVRRNDAIADRWDIIDNLCDALKETWLGDGPGDGDQRIGIKLDDEGEYVVALDEFELHDWAVGLAHTNQMTPQPIDEHGGTWFTKVRIVPRGYKTEEGELIMIDPDEIKDLEDAANKLLRHVRSFDTLVHDIAEYSC